MKLTSDAKGTDAARRYLAELLRNGNGSNQYADYIRHELAGDFAWELVNRLLSPNVAQGAEKLCTICNGYGRYQDGNSGTEADGYAPNIVECECTDEERRHEYRDAASPAQHKSDWHPDFVIALYDNADPDKRYTMDQMREYADAFHRSRIDAANVAQGAEAVRQLEQANGSWLDVSEDAYDSTEAERRRIVYTAPPAQTALTDKQILEIADRHLYWGKVCYVSADRRTILAFVRALTAAQSASGDTK